MNKKEIISEISRMKSLFSYQKGIVISEQQLYQNQGQFSQSQGFLVDCAGVGGLPTTAQMQQNFQAQTGLDPKLPENKKFYCNTIEMTKKLIEVKTQNQNRQTNINIAYSKVDPQGIIRNPGSAVDGDTWESYVSTYSVTADEIEKAKATTKPKTQQQQPQFVAEKFPLKYMMQGENVKKLQQALGLKTKSGQPNISGKFYNATQTALDLKARELGITYDRNIGLDEASFNEIIQAAQPKRELEKAVPVSARTETPNLTNLTPTLPANIQAPQIQAPQIQPIQTQLTLDQQFQVAKANLDQAKEELDAAQKTGDRVAIGTARGKQQAARQEVRRLRNELYLQSQQQPQ